MTTGKTFSIRRCKEAWGAAVIAASAHGAGCKDEENAWAHIHSALLSCIEAGCVWEAVATDTGKAVGMIAAIPLETMEDGYRRHLLSNIAADGFEELFSPEGACLVQTAKNTLWIPLVATGGEYRRRGVGTRLLKRVLDMHPTRDCIAFPSPEAEDLFRKAGFVSPCGGDLPDTCMVRPAVQAAASPPRPCTTKRRCGWRDLLGCRWDGTGTPPCLEVPDGERLTHDDLVGLAMRWLDAKGFRVIVSEPGYRREQPDAVGFKSGGFSCLVECKASRRDFLHDRDKPFRKDPATGIGTMRVYLVAPGVCTVDDLPAGWQLLEALDRDTLVLRRGAKGCLEMSREWVFREKLWQAEWDLLHSWAYRKLNGCLKEVPRTGRALRILEKQATWWSDNT